MTGRYLEGQLPNIKFLVAGGCDLDVGLGAAAARVGERIVGNGDSEDPPLQRLLATLLALRKKS